MTATPDALAPTVVLLAAGARTPFAPVGPADEPLLAYALHDAQKAGAGDAILVVGPDDIEPATQLIDSLLSRILPVHVAVHRPDHLPGAMSESATPARSAPWGSAHVLLAARALVQRAVVVVHADAFYGADAIAAAVDFARALEGRRRDGKQLRPTGALIGYPVASTTGARSATTRSLITMAADGRITSLEEVRDIRTGDDGALIGEQLGMPITLDDESLAAMDCWVLPQAAFALLEQEFAAYLEAEPEGDFALAEAVTALVTRNAMRVMLRRTSGPWFGLGHDDDLTDARARLQALTDEKVYPARLAG